MYGQYSLVKVNVINYDPSLATNGGVISCLMEERNSGNNGYFNLYPGTNIVPVHYTVSDTDPNGFYFEFSNGIFYKDNYNAFYLKKIEVKKLTGTTIKYPTFTTGGNWATMTKQDIEYQGFEINLYF